MRVRVQRQVRRPGPNSFGEELSPGAVDDCYLGLLVDQPLAEAELEKDALRELAKGNF